MVLLNYFNMNWGIKSSNSMRCRVANMAKKALPGFPSALKKTILSGMFTLNLSVLMLFQPNMGPCKKIAILT